MAINLEKSVEQVKIVLEKISFSQPIDVVVVVDVSASMMSDFYTGKMDELLDRLLAIGITMDQNQEIEAYTFGNRAIYAGKINRSNHVGFIKSNPTPFEFQGGTMYSTAIKMVLDDNTASEVATVEQKPGFLNKLLGRKVETITYTDADPTVVFFITDGETFDHSETEALIRKASNASIFWQFIGIGNNRFPFLEKLDLMQGRTVDNANFFSAGDISSISDNELYSRILCELPSWYQEAKQVGVIK